MIIYKNGNVTIDASVECITPEKAKEYLERNPNNRTLIEKRARRFAEEMEHNGWLLNGEAIVFDELGNLKNGQHRLRAVIISGIATEFVVIRGIQATLFDRGGIRTETNIFEMEGQSSKLRSQTVIGAINYLYLLKTNCNDISHARRKAFIQKNEKNLEIAYTASLIGSQHATCKKAPVVAALFCAAYCGVSIDALNEFCNCVNSGFYSGDGQTSTVIARKAIDGYSNKGVTKKEIFDVTLAALDDFVNKRPRRRVYSGLKTHEYAKRVLAECVL